MTKRIQIFILLSTISTCLFADDQKGSWITNYYATPSPENFVSEVRKLSREGILSDTKSQQNVAVFLSQLMIRHPVKSLEWLNQLNTLGEEEKKTLWYAAWLANTENSRNYLQSIEATDALQTSPPNFLIDQIDSPAHLDALWAIFFATGSEEPIRKIITAFNYDIYMGSIEAYKTSSKTEEGRKKAILEGVFLAARWSLQSNIGHHKLVAIHCEKINADLSLTNTERLWLGVVLSKVMPQKYKMTKVKPGEWKLETLN